MQTRIQRGRLNKYNKFLGNYLFNYSTSDSQALLYCLIQLLLPGYKTC